MRVRWKLLGLAAFAGVTAGGVAVARRRRAQAEYTPDELRERLHRRLAEVERERADEQAASEPPAA